MSKGSNEPLRGELKKNCLASQAIEEEGVAEAKNQEPQGEGNRPKDPLGASHQSVGVGASPASEKAKPMLWPGVSCSEEMPSMAYSHSAWSDERTQRPQ